jgi:uncharacterized iron-regulated protein
MAIRVILCGLTFLLAGCASSGVVRVSDGGRISVARLVEEVQGVRLVFIGEIHDDSAHHAFQAEVIKGLHRAGIPLAIGLEMFTSESQPELDEWLAGKADDGSFARLYALNWHEPYELYGEIFRYARDNRIPLVGINVPRRLIQEVKQHGFQALPEEARRMLPPEIRCEVTGDYLKFMKRVNAEHRGSDAAFVHFCEAMTLWNSLMARTVADYLDGHPGMSMVVLAGVGHARKSWGIPERLDAAGGRYSYRVVLPEVREIRGLPQGTEEESDYLLEEPHDPEYRRMFGF